MWLPAEGAAAPRTVASRSAGDSGGDPRPGRHVANAAFALERTNVASATCSPPGRLTADAQPATGRHRDATNVVIVTTTVPTLPARPEPPSPHLPARARPAGPASRWPRCSRPPPPSTSGGCRAPAGPTPSTPPRRRPAGESWKAWFFGSSDAANAITVDKTPAALWVIGLSVRIFGLSSWSVLVPQALMGVASVGLLYAAVKRARRAGAPGLHRRRGAGADPGRGADVPVQQPGRPARAAADRRGVRDAARASRSGGTRWLVLAGVLVGVRVPREDAAGVPRAAGADARCGCSPRPSAGGGGSGTCCSRASRCWSAPAGGCSSSSCGPPPTRARTSAARRTTACWSSCSATTASAG